MQVAVQLSSVLLVEGFTHQTHLELATGRAWEAGYVCIPIERAENELCHQSSEIHWREVLRWSLRSSTGREDQCVWWHTFVQRRQRTFRISNLQQNACQQFEAARTKARFCWHQNEFQPL